jgi:hypothetical protein
LEYQIGHVKCMVGEGYVRRSRSDPHSAKHEMTYSKKIRGKSIYN